MNRLGFIAPDGLTVEEVEDRLVSAGLRPEPPTTVQRTYYDTFDARLYRAGWVLELECMLDGDEAPAPRAGASWLRLRPLTGAQGVLEQPATSIPRRADDLADDRLRVKVGDLAGGRALLAQLDEAPSRERLFRCLGPEDKTVARVVVASDAGGPPAVASGRASGRAPSVWALPVRGYDDELAALARALEGLIGGGGVADPFEVASRAAGRDPGVDPSAFDVRLEPDWPAYAAVRALLGRLFEVMVANEAGVRGDLDDEFLHDFRVAVRRARSVLSVSRAVLPEERRLWLAGELRWLGQLTGPPRDLDVLLEDLSGNLSRPDAATERTDLAPFVAQLQTERRSARAALMAGLDSERYRLLLDGAHALAGTDVPTDRRAVELAEHCVRRSSRRLMRQGRAAVTDEDWHEVRKAGKRLRYVIEGFRSLLGAESADVLATLKRLQNVLGDAQDRAAHAALIREVALRWAAAAPAESSPSTARGLLAAGGLVEHHRSRGRKIQAEAAAAFAAFDTRDTRARLRRLVPSDPDASVIDLAPSPHGRG